jgi:NADH dehydrogenase
LSTHARNSCSAFGCINSWRGTGDPTADYGTLLGDGVQLVVDSAARIDTDSRTVLLGSGDTLNYDYVIYAVGSTATLPAGVPGAAEFAYPVAEFEPARRLRVAIEASHPDAPITVVGAGLTGIEVAAELAEQGRPVALICGGRLAPSFSEPARRSVATWLTENGVDVLGAAVTEVRPDALVLDDRAVRPSAVTIWAGGFGVPELAARSGLRTDALGQLLTDETLTSVDDDRVVGAGDAVGPGAADGLLHRRTHGRHGRRHRAEPHRRSPACPVQPGVRGVQRRPEPAGRRGAIHP